MIYQVDKIEYFNKVAWYNLVDNNIVDFQPIILILTTSEGISMTVLPSTSCFIDQLQD